MDMLRSCYETWMRFPGLSSEWIKIRWVFVDGETKSVPPTVYSSLNWEPPERHAGERKGLSRKWVDGSKPPVAFDPFFGSDEAWLGNTDENSPIAPPSTAFKCPPPVEPEEIPPPPTWAANFEPGGGRGWSGWYFQHGLPGLPGDSGVFLAVCMKVEDGYDPRWERPLGPPLGTDTLLSVADVVQGSMRLIVYQVVPSSVGGPFPFGIAWERFENGQFDHTKIEKLDIRGVTLKGPVSMGAGTGVSGTTWTHRPRCGPLTGGTKARAYLAVVAGAAGGTTPGNWTNGFERVGVMDTRFDLSIDMAVKTVWRETPNGVVTERRDQGAQGWMSVLLPIDGPWR